MFPSSSEVLSVIAIMAIIVIMTVYFIVMKRKGWLRGEASNGSFYRCPNPECREIFEKPIRLTDLSETPARVYLACPHCGFDLKRTSLSRIPEKHEMAVKIPPSPEKPKITIGDLLSMKKQGRLEELGVPVETSETATSVEVRERPKTPAAATEIPRSLEEPLGEESQEERAEGVEAPEISKDKQPPTTPTEGPEASPPGCPHFFGYLKEIPKNASIPDKCLGCPKIVECRHSSVISE